MPRMPPYAFCAWLLVTLFSASSAPGQQAETRPVAPGPGMVVPLSEVLAATRRMVPGKIIDVELESDVDLEDEKLGTRWVYEVEVLTDDNRVVELEFDAHTGRLLEIDGAPWPEGVPRPPP